MEVKVCLDNKCYLVKPKDAEAGQISKRIGGQIEWIDSKNIIRFAKDVGLDGRTFCPATFKNAVRKKDNFEQIQLFVLDFDNAETDKTVSFEEVKDRADKYQLPILFAYETFTSKNRDKFRVLFLNDVPITAARDAEVLQKALVKIFPECDQCGIDISHMYYGGGKDDLLYFDEDTPKVNIISTIASLTKYMEDRYTANSKRNVANFIRETHLGTNNHGMPDVSIIEDLSSVSKNAEITGAIPHNDEKRTVDENSPNSINTNNISIIEFGEKSLKNII
jgi:hypothetical protein